MEASRNTFTLPNSQLSLPTSRRVAQEEEEVVRYHFVMRGERDDLRDCRDLSVSASSGHNVLPQSSLDVVLHG
eukprot:scaffold26_cov159-Ochromonas_danica.AAC.10